MGYLPSYLIQRYKRGGKWKLSGSLHKNSQFYPNSFLQRSHKSVQIQGEGGINCKGVERTIGCHLGRQGTIFYA